MPFTIRPSVYIIGLAAVTFFTSSIDCFTSFPDKSGHSAMTDLETISSSRGYDRRRQMRSKPIYKPYIVKPFLRLLRLRLLADPRKDGLKLDTIIKTPLCLLKNLPLAVKRG